MFISIRESDLKKIVEIHQLRSVSFKCHISIICENKISFRISWSRLGLFIVFYPLVLLNWRIPCMLLLEWKLWLWLNNKINIITLKPTRLSYKWKQSTAIMPAQWILWSLNISVESLDFVSETHLPWVCLKVPHYTMFTITDLCCYGNERHTSFAVDPVVTYTAHTNLQVFNI